ncbi:hypothetical protein B8281_16005 [Cellulosimicrobium sp. TH-20]|uniref:hypothetical protein n=1 Tax=Cellulosimicrobium sp. TH-20 TaxID=1980001 RepID=UPI000A17D001|nr:hypothetical protein [Cellulosimicrobium sp. TH-20]ARK05996.1 hypothetical protein B8281_16005 [Cellulosimicrobium sp. TH-20]
MTLKPDLLMFTSEGSLNDDGVRWLARRDAYLKAASRKRLRNTLLIAAAVLTGVLWMTRADLEAGLKFGGVLALAVGLVGALVVIVRGRDERAVAETLYCEVRDAAMLMSDADRRRLRWKRRGRSAASLVTGLLGEVMGLDLPLSEDE